MIILSYGENKTGKKKNVASEEEGQGILKIRAHWKGTIPTKTQRRGVRNKPSL